MELARKVEFSERKEKRKEKGKEKREEKRYASLVIISSTIVSPFETPINYVLVNPFSSSMYLNLSFLFSISI